MKITFRRRLALCVLLLQVALWSTGCSDKGQVFEKTVPGASLRNNVLGDSIERTIAVYLPPSYASSGKRYPAVYMLQGFDTVVSEYLDSSRGGHSFPGLVDRSIRKGETEEMIVVIISGRNVLGGSFYVNSPVIGNWEDFVMHDVVRYVDRNYKTRPYAESRGIAGQSMGGFGALNIAMKHPDVFSAVYSMSPGLFDENGFSQMGMFTDRAVVEELLRQQQELASMNRSEANRAFLSYVGQLYTWGEKRNVQLGRTYAYGAAFSPDPGANAPYIDYPYDIRDGRIVRNEKVWAVWERGLRSVADDVEAYKENLLALKAITIDVGENDRYQWIPPGCRYLSRRLDDVGVPHELLVHEGGHGDRFRERVEKHMLPFFSRVLVSE
jgi:S-formylglutathione hydrolase